MNYDNTPRLKKYLEDAGFHKLAQQSAFEISELLHRRHMLAAHLSPKEQHRDIAAFCCLTWNQQPDPAKPPELPIGNISPLDLSGVHHLLKGVLRIQTFIAVVLFLILLLLLTGTAHAQATVDAIRVPTCGTAPANYPTSGRAPLIVDANGNLCAGVTVTANVATGGLAPSVTIGSSTTVVVPMGARDTGGNQAPLQLDGAGAGHNLDVNCVVGCASATDTVGTPVTFNAATSSATVALAGQRGIIAFFNNNASYLGTVVANVSFDGGNTYTTAQFTNLTGLGASSTETNPTGGFAILIAQGATHASVTTNAYTSGSMVVTLRAVTYNPAEVLFGQDGTFLRALSTTATGVLNSNVANIGGTATVTGGASGLLGVGGPVASGASNADNPVKTGGVFNTTQPTVTNGQIVDAQYTARGGAIVSTGADTFTVTANVGTTGGLALDSSVNGLSVAQASTTSGQKGPLIQCATTTSPPTYTTAQTNPVSCDTAGNLRVNVLGGVATGYAQGSTTSGQLGPLIQGAVTTFPPSYTTAQTSPLSISTAGSLRVGLNEIAGNTAVTGGTAGSLGVGGLAASGTAVAGNPVLVAAANGANAQTLQTDANTNLKVVSPLITYVSTPPFLTNNGTHDFMIDEASNLKVGTGVVQQTLTAWNSTTALNATQNIYTSDGPHSVLVQLDQTSTISGGAINFQVTYDGVNWVNVTADQSLDPTSSSLAQISLPYTLQATTNKPFLILPHGAQGLRIILSTQITGTATVTPYYTLQYTHTAQEAVVFQASGTNLHMICDSGCSGSTAPQDNSAFTAGTTSTTPIAGFYHSVRDTVTDGRAANIAINNNRAVLVQLEDSSKNAINSTGNALNIYLSGSTATVTTNLASVNGTALGTPTNFGTTPGAVVAASVNASLFIGTTAAVNGGVAGSFGVGGLAAGGAAVVGNPVLAAGASGSTAQTMVMENGTPVATDYGLVVRNIPSGTQTVSGTITANAGTGTFNIQANASVAEGTAASMANGWPVAVGMSSGGTNTALVSDPCETSAGVMVSGSITTSTTIVTGTSAKFISICYLYIDVNANATNWAMVEGTGTLCATNLAANFGGGTTAAAGPNWAANKAASFGVGGYALYTQTRAADNLCLLLSASNQVNYNLKYVVQ